MRHLNSHNYYTRERDTALEKAYRHLIGEAKEVFLPDIFDRLVSLPAERFYVSEERATIVVNMISKGDDLSSMLPLRRSMYMEIYQRVCRLRALHPDMSVSQAVSEVVSSPAPSFYITPKSANVIISRIRCRKRHIAAMPPSR
ncbi:MAG: hypothetical protein IJR13_07775 [Bacteroidales bacterium]|nr:hypothetical protein [Bacteroidales bacterium]